MVPNMKAKYTADVAPALMKKFEYESVMQIPKIDKVVINVGCGKEANGNSKVIEAIVRDVTAISGQKPISSFVFNPMPKQPIKYAKAIQKNPVLIFVLYPNITATAMDATKTALNI